jgi:ATP-dependent protease ClpP protease subunit
MTGVLFGSAGQIAGILVSSFLTVSGNDAPAAPLTVPTSEASDQTATLNPAWHYAQEDEAIRSACPQIQDVQLKTVSSNAPLWQYERSNITIEGTLDLAARETPIWSRVDAVFDRLRQSTPNLYWVISINSGGGSTVMGQDFVEDMYESASRVVTYADDYASSMASLITFMGDERYIMHDTRIQLHEASNQLVATGERRWSDNPVLPEETQRNLNNFNNWFRQQYREASTTNISAACVDALIGKRDVEITPQTALKLGWVDYVILTDNSWMERRDETVRQRPARVMALSKGN